MDGLFFTEIRFISRGDCLGLIKIQFRLARHFVNALKVILAPRFKVDFDEMDAQFHFREILVKAREQARFARLARKPDRLDIQGFRSFFLAQKAIDRSEFKGQLAARLRGPSSMMIARASSSLCRTSAYSWQSMWTVPSRNQASPRSAMPSTDDKSDSSMSFETWKCPALWFSSADR